MAVTSISKIYRITITRRQNNVCYYELQTLNITCVLHYIEYHTCRNVPEQPASSDCAQINRMQGIVFRQALLEGKPIATILPLP